MESAILDPNPENLVGGPTVLGGRSGGSAAGARKEPLLGRERAPGASSSQPATFGKKKLKKKHKKSVILRIQKILE